MRNVERAATPHTARDFWPGRFVDATIISVKVIYTGLGRGRVNFTDPSSVSVVENVRKTEG